MPSDGAASFLVVAEGLVAGDSYTVSADGTDLGTVTAADAASAGGGGRGGPGGGGGPYDGGPGGDPFADDDDTTGS
jgi:hypothetical protein